MPESTILPTLFLKYTGIFDLGGLMNVVIDWFETRGYEVQVTKVKHKIKTGGFEDLYEIKGWMDETEYHRIEIIFIMRLWTGNYVEVVINGQQKKLMKARITIYLEGKLELDTTGRYENSMFARKLRDFLNTKVIKHRYDSIWGDRHYYKMHELLNYLKEYLDMQSKGKFYKNMW